MSRLTTSFGFASTAQDVIAGVDLSGKRAIVTGGGAGIGLETTRALAAAGAEVTLAVRRTDSGVRSAAEISASSNDADIAVRYLDLADRASIAHFVEQWRGPLHILVNNAGIMALPELTRTADGWEMQFATNFMGHFILTLALHRALAAAKGARIVSLSSSAHMYSPVLFDDPNFNFMLYEPFVAYGQSKTADALFAVEATRRWEGEGIFANAVNPGAIPTGLQKHIGAMKTPVPLRKSCQQGAATSVLLAASPLLQGIGGRYFEDCNEAEIIRARPTDFSGGVAAYAINPENARRLWDLALSFTG